MSLDVTDHAVVRYIERVLGFDVDDVRNRIRGICQNAARVGAKAVAHEGFTYQISRSGRTVVTVTPDKPHSVTGGHHPNRRRQRK